MNKCGLAEASASPGAEGAIRSPDGSDYFFSE